MIAKTRELNLDDLKTVSGGVKAVKVPVNAAQTQVMAAPVRPSASATFQPSVGIEQLLARRA